MVKTKKRKRAKPERLDISDVGVDFARDSVAQWLTLNGLDENYLRPTIEADGRAYYLRNFGSIDKPDYRPVLYTGNSTAQLRDNWLQLDREVLDAAAPELTAVGDLIAAGATKNIDGMAEPVHAYQFAGDITEATISMDGLKRARRDKPVFGIGFVPVPLIYKDIEFGQRELAVNTRGARPFPIDTYTLQLATRKCAQLAESLLIGNTTFSYQGFSVYGYRTHPSRITKTLTLPTANGWTPNTLVDELTDMRQSLRNRYQTGPYRVYISSGWETYLEKDYSEAYPGGSLRQRLLKIDQIQSIKTLDFLDDYQILMVDMTRGTVQLLIGMQPRVVQWSEMGGVAQNWRTMLCMVPRFRPDNKGYLGVCHGTAA